MKDDKFKGAPGFTNKGIVSDTSADALKGSALDKAQGLVESEGLSHLENLAGGLDKKVAENIAKAKEAEDKAKQVAAMGKQLTSGTSGYQHQIGGVTGSINSPENLSLNSNIVNPDGGMSNAAAILKHIIPGVNHLVDITAIAEGVSLNNFKSLYLKQNIDTHHEFVLELSHDALGEEETYEMLNSHKLLGKRILITINYKNIKEKPERDFIGVITDVSFKQSHGSRGYIVLTGYSPTVLLDRAYNKQSFAGKQPESLSSIVHTMLEEGFGGKEDYKYKIKITKTANLSYSAQYNETHYNYLARMAEAYGEQFFYDGDTLYFGDFPPMEKPIQLVYGRDVESIEETLHGRHVNRDMYGYNSYTNESLSASGDTKLEMKGTLAKEAYKISEQMYPAPSLQLAPMKASTSMDITQAQHGVRGSEAIGVFDVKGITTVPFLYPGCIVELEMIRPGTKVSNHFTTMMITEIIHTVDTLGKYKGHFTAVDAGTGFIPRVAYTTPVSELQIGTVVSNADPAGKGRVQVQFAWQYGGQCTEWIRVMTPDAGSSDKVSTNRGFVAIPEKGDQVIVGFIGNHPDRPLVQGGVFHGQTATGGGKNNQDRSFSSKSGNALRFNDNKGSLTIKDGGINEYKNGNSVTLLFDGQGNSNMTCGYGCSITATSHINLILDGGIDEDGAPKVSPAKIIIDRGGEISIEATNYIELVVGQIKVVLDDRSKEGIFSVEAKNVKIKGTETLNLTGSSNTIDLEENVIKAKGGQIDLN